MILAGIALIAAIASGAEPIPLEPLPQKTVVLTFDDAVRSHLTVVAPLLKKHGFGATFFVTHAWMDDTEHFLSWEEIAELHRLGFEVGNHTWNHAALHEANGASLVEEEIEAVEQALRQVGVPRCTSVSWPGCHFGPEAHEALHQRGYRFARRGTLPEGGPASAPWMGPLYDPETHDPLLVPATGLAQPDWTLEDFQRVVDRAEAGRIVVLAFHGVPDGAHPFCSTPPERFEEFMSYLAENGFTVLAMRDLSRYLTVEPRPEDPLFQTRFFK